MLTRCVVVCLLVCGLAAFSPQRDAVVPRITAPVLFDTPEADRILSRAAGVSAGQPVARRHLRAAACTRSRRDRREHRRG